MELSIELEKNTNNFIETVYNVKTFYKSIFAVADAAKERGLVIYGAGKWGFATLEIFKLFGIGPKCFCDDDAGKIGQDFHGVNVISLDEAAEKYSGAIFIVGEINEAVDCFNFNRKAMQDELRKRGLLSEFSGVLPIRYTFLLDGGLESLNRPQKLDREIKLPENLIFFNRPGHSGSVYFEGLLDGHPNMLILPFVRGSAAREYDIVYQKRLQYLEDEELAVEVAAQLYCYYYSDYHEESLINNIFISHNGYDGKALKNGIVDAKKVLTCVRSLVMGKGKISFAYFLKVIYTAYNYAAGKTFDTPDPHYIFGHIHDLSAGLSLWDGLINRGDFERVEYWIVVREPINRMNSLFKLVCGSFTENSEINPLMIHGWHWEKMTDDTTGCFLEKKDGDADRTIKIFRYEDLKYNTEKYMRSICSHMGVKYSDCMLETTLNGVPTVWRKGNKLIDAKDTSPITMDYQSRYLTSFDEFRLNLAFQDFRTAYGYENDLPDYTAFTEDFLRELYSIPFKFEKELVETAEEYLRRGFIDKVPDYHDAIANVLLNWILEHREKGHPELVGEVFKSLGNEE